MLFITSGALADLKIRMKRVEGNRTGETILYFKGVRQRQEFLPDTVRGRQPYKFAWIMQCDSHRLIGVNDDNRTYFVHAGGEPANASDAFNEVQYPTVAAQRDRRSGGVLRETYTIVDTGERREMFGFVARHIRTTREWDATPQRCKQARLREETDGWYVDLLYGVECSPDISGHWNQAVLAPCSRCRDYYNRHHYQFERTQVGSARMGFPLMLTVKMYDDEGHAVLTSQETLEVSREELDARLFDVPAGYAELKLKPYSPSLLDRFLAFLQRIVQ